MLTCPTNDPMNNLKKPAKQNNKKNQTSKSLDFQSNLTHEPQLTPLVPFRNMFTDVTGYPDETSQRFSAGSNETKILEVATISSSTCTNSITTSLSVGPFILRDVQLSSSAINSTLKNSLSPHHHHHLQSMFLQSQSSFIPPLQSGHQSQNACSGNANDAQISSTSTSSLSSSSLHGSSHHYHHQSRYFVPSSSNNNSSGISFILQTTNF